MLARKILGIDIRKTALHTLIRKIEVDENGQLGFDFYLASDVLASTPTAVHTLRWMIFPHKRSNPKTA